MRRYTICEKSLAVFAQAKWRYLLPLIFLTSCSYHETEGHELSLSKQKQRVTLLQKKLELAEKEEQQLKTKIDTLKTTLRDTQLGLIRKKVDEYEKGLKKKEEESLRKELFLEEKAKLKQILQKDTASFEAQVVLDRILDLLTEEEV